MQMNTNHDGLKVLGWSDWFEKRATDQPGTSIARVAAVDREQLLLVDPAGPFRAKLSGSFLHRHPLPHEHPCVGDWVCLDRQPGDDFGVCGAENGIEGGYSDIAGLSANCRYRNCTHTGEPGCAIREAVQSGDLSREHFDNYRKLRHESEFHQLSHAEKRKRDRDFGKFLKTAKKTFRDK